MMGHRGGRLGITYPEIYEMQIKAVFEATANLVKQKINAKPQIMIPQVGSIEALNHIKAIYDDIKSEIQSYVDDLNRQFANPEQIKKFSIIPRDFTIDHGELTPTLKIRRKQINENWSDIIESMYIT